MSVALSAAPERKLAAPLIAFALLVLGGLFLFNAVSARQAILFIVGGALGLTLYHAA
ncbi:YeeE/YedE family protein, partial [Pseudomonas aeruginosa]|nr:YeeE/YedE family protein [Pseudomonas aeruginosa]